MFLRLMKLTPPATTEKSTLAGCELVKRDRPVNGRSGGVCVCIFVVTSIIVYITTYVKTLNALLLN